MRTIEQSTDSSQLYFIDSTLSKRIHSLRFLLIVLVVFIHNIVIERGINFADGTQTFFVPVYVFKIKEFVGTFTCAAVPLFFIISSLLLYSKEIKFTDNVKKKCKTILLPYFLWITLEIIFRLVMQNFSFAKPYIANLITDFSVWDWLGAFTGKSGFFAADGLPLNGPFWFLRDLFILNIFFLVIKKVIDAFPAGSFILFFILWIGEINIHIVGSGALFFFALGYYIVKYNIDYKKLDHIKIYDIGIMYSITIILRLFFADKIPVIHCINALIGVLFLIKCSNYFIMNEKIYRLLLELEKQQFFVYAAHGVFLTILIKLSSKIMPMNGGWLLIHYFGICVLCIILLTVIGMFFRKVLPKMFSIMNGGR
jgi:hypothetical protein